MHGQKCSAWRAITQRGHATLRTRDGQSCTEVRGQRSSWLCKRATSRAKAPAGEPWAMGRCVGVALTDLLDAICESAAEMSWQRRRMFPERTLWTSDLAQHTRERRNGPFPPLRLFQARQAAALSYHILYGIVDPQTWPLPMVYGCIAGTLGF